MKTLLAIACSVLLATTAFAQPEVTKAYNANRAGDYADAAGYIDQAIANPKAATKEKTWRYRGQIFFNIAQDSSLRAQFPDAISTSIESYQKAKEIDARGSYEKENNIALTNLQLLASNQAIDAYNVGDYAGAAKGFDVATALASTFGVTDTLLIFNSALSHEKAGNAAQAIAGYKRCGELNYNVPNVYIFAANIHKAQEDTTAALNLLQEARMSHPRDQSIIIETLNIYLTRGDYDQALTNLQAAAEGDPTNEVLFFSMGSVNDQLGNFEAAEESYQKALAIKPDYFDANYNLGALYFNQGVEKVNAANEIKDNKKYTAALDEANGIFSKARPYLEKAHEVMPEDESTMRSLRDVYVRLGEDDLFLEINNKIKALGN